MNIKERIILLSAQLKQSAAKVQELSAQREKALSDTLKLQGKLELLQELEREEKLAKESVPSVDINNINKTT